MTAAVKFVEIKIGLMLEESQFIFVRIPLAFAMPPALFACRAFVSVNWCLIIKATGTAAGEPMRVVVHFDATTDNARVDCLWKVNTIGYVA